MTTEPDTQFVIRVLLGMRDDIEKLLETAARMQIQYNTLVKEHGLDEAQQAVNRAA
jgi:hypothetical protein